MGDRGNIVIRYDLGDGKKSDVYFYTHWSGTEIGQVVQKALAKRERWDDDSYLARIIFDGLVGKDTGTTGFGISPTITDNEHDLLVVDTGGKRVLRTLEASPDVAEKEWTFDEFVKATGVDEWP